MSRWREAHERDERMDRAQVLGAEWDRRIANKYADLGSVEETARHYGISFFTVQAVVADEMRRLRLTSKRRRPTQKREAA